MIRFHILSLFPESLTSYLGSSILKRAQDASHLEVHLYNIRDFTTDKHRKADDRPYGGGPGMVMYAEPILAAIGEIKAKTNSKKTKILLTSPAGKLFSNTVAKAYSKKYTDIILVCGHYEGIDARVKRILKAEEISIGPYILTGGELPALVMIDSIARQIEGVLGDSDSVEENRVASSEVYTRPEILEYKGKKYRVPPVLLSGHHKKIEEWKRNTQK